MGIKTGRGQYESKWIEECNRYGLEYGMEIVNGVWNRLDCTVYYERLHLDKCRNNPCVKGSRREDFT